MAPCNILKQLEKIKEIFLLTVQTLEINAEEESCQVDTEFCLEGRMIHTSSKGVMDIFSHYIMSWCDEAVAIIRGEQFTKSLRKTFSKS